MSNGLYNGLDNGLQKGEYNGQLNGLELGMFDNEIVIKKQVIQEGLQLYLDFSNPRCYNSGIGQIGDTVSNLVNGSTKKLTIGNLTGRTTANAPYVEYNPIPYWNNYTLNGTGQNYLTSPNNTDFDIGISTSGATWSMWVNIPVSCPDYSVFMGKTIAGFVVGRWQMYFMNTMAVGFLIQIDNNTFIQSANNVLKLDTWHCLTATYIRDYGIRLYVDNKLVAEGTTTPTISNITVNAPFRIGTHSGNINASGARFKMNYATIYNRCLTRSELTYNYNTTKQFMKV